MSWQRIARRIRVPLGFAFAALYLWLARPAWTAMAAGSVLIVAGLALRALASGHVRKDAEVTAAGPYAYVRHPLYAGTLLLAAGFAIAARSLWLAAAMVVFFVAVYLPVVRSEEAFLRAGFPGYQDYARRVPRFIPRLRGSPPRGAAAGFSWELYCKHREWNALLGAAAMLLALALKLLWTR